MTTLKTNNFYVKFFSTSSSLILFVETFVQVQKQNTQKFYNDNDINIKQLACK